MAILNAYTNGIPFENLVEADTLAEAVLLAVNIPLAECYIREGEY
jgi:hypothetical protein